MRELDDLTGKRFGKLVVEGRADDYIIKNGRHFRRWICRCDCGGIKVAKESYLKNGTTNHCGCETKNRRSKAKTKDLTGKRFGHLLVICRSTENIHNRAAWVCKCDCGNVVTVESTNLITGNTKSCGCSRIDDISGQKYGMLTIEKYVGKNKSGNSMWKCKCDCGNVRIFPKPYFRNSKILNCGCNINGKSMHGMTGTRLYIIWRGMKERCFNPNCNTYKDYGARGISICQEWIDDFMNFYNWSMANGYSDDLTIDRINNGGDYKPSNCRWTTKLTQANNKRNNRYIEYNGKNQTIAQWSRETGIKSATINNRLNKNLPLDEVFSKRRLNGKNNC